MEVEKKKAIKLAQEAEESLKIAHTDKLRATAAAEILVIKIQDPKKQLVMIMVFLAFKN